MEEQVADIENRTVGELEENSSKPLWARVTDKVSLGLLVSNIPFMLFVAVLCGIYIYNINKASELVRAIDKKSEELKEVKWEYTDVQARLINATSATELRKKAEPLGLQPLEKPVFEIKNTITITQKK